MRDEITPPARRCVRHRWPMPGQSSRQSRGPGRKSRPGSALLPILRAPSLQSGNLPGKRTERSACSRRRRILDPARPLAFLVRIFEVDSFFCEASHRDSVLVLRSLFTFTVWVSLMFYILVVTMLAVGRGSTWQQDARSHFARHDGKAAKAPSMRSRKSRSPPRSKLGKSSSLPNIKKAYVAPLQLCSVDLHAKTFSIKDIKKGAAALLQVALPPPIDRVEACKRASAVQKQPRSRAAGANGYLSWPLREV